jgi:hypothetical protein
VYRNGLRLRDRLAHAECDTACLPRQLAWFGFALATALCARMPLRLNPQPYPPSANTTALCSEFIAFVESYQSAFSPKTQWFQSLARAHRQLIAFDVLCDALARAQAEGASATTTPEVALACKFTQNLDKLCNCQLPISPFVLKWTARRTGDATNVVAAPPLPLPPAPEWYDYITVAAYRKWRAALDGSEQAGRLAWRQSVARMLVECMQVVDASCHGWTRL